MRPVQFVVLGVVILLIDLAAEAAIGGRWSLFQSRGVAAAVGNLAVNFAIILFFAKVDPRPATIRHLAILLFGVTLVANLLGVGVEFLETSQPESDEASSTVAWLHLALAILAVAWIVGGSRKIFALVVECHRPTLRACGFALSLLLGAVLWPSWPMLPPPKFSSRTANLWSVVASYRLAAREAQRNAQDAETAAAAEKREQALAALELAQPQRMETALAGLAPRTAKKRNVYVLAIADSDSETVFESETRNALDVLTHRFGADGHTLWLVNGEPKQGEPPLATLPNIALSLRAIAARMVKENDLLVLAMSSHGSKAGFLLQKDDVVGRLLDAKALRATLDEVGIKNRFLIVSACYSGVFVPEFSNPRSAVVTAASAEHASFGCQNDREWTYFGDAFYAHGLNDGVSIPAAFDKAQALVAAWERAQQFTPSEPQIFVGEEFKRWFPDFAGVAPQSPEAPRAILEKSTTKTAPAKLTKSAPVRKAAAF